MDKQIHSRQLAFGPFVLDVTDKQLLRDGKAVALTPKAFELLVLLVENPGRLLEKKELMNRLWPATFVEEANLSNNISALRKVLGEFSCIETVPRRGYRFVADVTELNRDLPTAEALAEKPDAVVTAGNDSSRVFPSVRYIASGALLTFAAVMGWLLIHRSQPLTASPFVTPRITRLTTSGRARATAISPDGKYVAYVIAKTAESEDEMSLWVRQVATTTDIQIAPPAGVVYQGLSFSKDGNFVYYIARDHRDLADLTLYQVPTLGGIARKVHEQVHTPITFSPDGKQFAFVRRSPGWKETSLIITNTDGSGERTLATRKMPNGFGSIFAGPAWSPDGNLIAVGVETGDGQLVQSTVVAIHLADGAEESITPASWSRVGRLAWMPDGRGIVLAAAKQLDIYQLWYLPYPSGEAHSITNNESMDYSGLSLTADGHTAVSIQNDITSRIWMADSADLKRPQGPLTAGKYDGRHGLRWTPDGRIVYHSLAGGSEDIWIMAGDGTNPKQMTFDTAADGEPDVSPDGRFVVVSSQRGGGFDLSRTEMVGNNTKQLTKGMDARVPQITPDGKWVIFTGRGNGLWKVPFDGGEATLLNNNEIHSPALSPDGEFIACYYRENPEQPIKLAVIPVGAERPIQVFDLNAPAQGGFQLRWTTDGQNITFRDHGNLWNQPLNGGKPIKLTDINGVIRQFDWSRDGVLVFSVLQRDSDAMLVRDLR